MTATVTAEDDPKPTCDEKSDFVEIVILSVNERFFVLHLFSDHALQRLHRSAYQQLSQDRDIRQQLHVLPKASVFQVQKQ
jgi:hypothetical protein